MNDARFIANYYPLWSMRTLLAAIAKHEGVEPHSHTFLMAELRHRIFMLLPAWSRARRSR